MTIRCQCPRCAATLKVRDDLAGAERKCPQCSQLLRVPLPVELPEPPLVLTTQIDRRQTTERKAAEIVQKYLPAALIVVGGFCAMILWRTANWKRPDFVQQTVFPYGGLLLACLGMYFIFRRIWQHNRWFAKCLGVAVTIGTFWLYGRSDRSTSVWDIKEDHGRFAFRDTYTRWGHRHLHREMRVWYDPNGSITWLGDERQSGPMSESGKPHGRWTIVVWKKRWSKLTSGTGTVRRSPKVNGI